MSAAVACRVFSIAGVNLHTRINCNIEAYSGHARVSSIRHRVILRKAGAPVSWRRRWRLLDRGSISASGAMSLASHAWANVCKEK